MPKTAYPHEDHYQIQTENGTLKRVNIEHGLVEDGRIVALQHELKAALPDLRLKDRADLHVTMFHFGKPEELFAEIQNYHPGLDFDGFYHAFLVLLAETEKTVPEPVTMTGHKLALFGNHEEPVLALQLQSNEGLAAAHHAIELHFINFLTAMGIDDLVGFMRDSYLHYQLDSHFLPHVSLGRLSGRDELPPIDVTNIEITLTPSRLRNVKVRREGAWVWSS